MTDQRQEHPWSGLVRVLGGHEHGAALKRITALEAEVTVLRDAVRGAVQRIDDERDHALYIGPPCADWESLLVDAVRDTLARALEEADGA